MTPMGRPKIINPKSIQVVVRMGVDTFAKLDESAKHLKITRVEVIRRGIEKIYGEIVKK